MTELITLEFRVFNKSNKIKLRQNKRFHKVDTDYISQNDGEKMEEGLQNRENGACG